MPPDSPTTALFMFCYTPVNSLSKGLVGPAGASPSRRKITTSNSHSDSLWQLIFQPVFDSVDDAAAIEIAPRLRTFGGRTVLPRSLW